ncbi:MAG: YicC family protein [Candidatus Aminicenantes bacterium]|nr:YicC family protein [Candidatus Aminicenantes bacterium]
MIQSMTGFAEKTFISKTFSAKITIKSLNHRFFDWNFRGNQLGSIENRLRKLCQRELQRSRVDVQFELEFSDPERWEVQINENLLAQILSTLGSLSQGSNVTFSLDNLFGVPHVVEIKRKNLAQQEFAFLEKAFAKTLQELIKTRRREGRQLRLEILTPIKTVQQHLKHIERLGKRQPLLIKKKLRERLQELGNEGKISEAKLFEETAYMAQRYDLAEEIERLKSHLLHFQELMNTKESQPVGKKLDFVAQELFRETNTINSKAQDLEIIKRSLAVKGELESIRQQVQNLA